MPTKKGNVMLEIIKELTEIAEQDDCFCEHDDAYPRCSICSARGILNSVGEDLRYELENIRIYIEKEKG
jgi:hypothetical protein